MIKHQQARFHVTKSPIVVVAVCTGLMAVASGARAGQDAAKSQTFSYNGKTRIAEPQCYGIGSKGTELLRVHQIQGGTQPEPLFDVAKILDLVVLDEHFERPGPNYTRNDSAMKTIFAQL